MADPPANDELFSPEGSAMTSLPASSRGSPSQNPRSFVIEPPLLAIALKNTYKMSSDTSLKPDDLKVDEVIGEYHVDGVLYYFARYAGGIAYKVGVDLMSLFAAV
jgi:chromodomain-helicase-DNA-binding protein 4